MRTFPLCLVLFLTACHTDPPKTQPAGAPTSKSTELLKTGARALQSDAAPASLDIHLIGFHPMKDNPMHQMTAHHFCSQVNEDFAQCALFDGNTRDANLNGIEYIISETLFATLPPHEKKYWHPHNYEILSGQLIGPGLPDAAEKEFLRRKMNSYGKTFHLWMTDGGDKLPLGEPRLAWSFNHDGEIRPGLIEQRDKHFGTNTQEKQNSRQDLAALAKPQEGENALGAR